MDKEKAMLWQQRIQECMSSGLSVKRWCKEKHVSSPSFYYWKNQLEKEQDEIPEKTMSVFVDVTPTAPHIYFACGPTDFRKQTESLSALVYVQFKLDPYAGDCVFVFCNKRRNAIKVLRYDYNGFILASKKLLDGMKFQWPRTPDEVKEVTPQQLKWLLDGLSIEQKKAHHDVKMSRENCCF